jgi:hypothetical protein
MTKTGLIVAASIAGMALAGCSGSGEEAAPAEGATATEDAAEAAEAPPADSGTAAEEAATADGTSGSIEANCLAAVASEVGVPVGEVSIMGVEESEAAISVQIQVPEAIAPWQCLANRDGSVEEVMFTGSEGEL